MISPLFPYQKGETSPTSLLLGEEGQNDTSILSKPSLRVVQKSTLKWSVSNVHIFQKISSVCRSIQETSEGLVPEAAPYKLIFIQLTLKKYYHASISLKKLIFVRLLKIIIKSNLKMQCQSFFQYMFHLTIAIHVEQIENILCFRNSCFL